LARGTNFEAITSMLKEVRPLYYDAILLPC
jgi:hypothetical protein